MERDEAVSDTSEYLCLIVAACEIARVKGPAWVTSVLRPTRKRRLTQLTARELRVLVRCWRIPPRYRSPHCDEVDA
jgi:hypothetical protein